MKHTLKVTLTLVFLFLTSQLVGLGITYQYIDLETTQITGEISWQALPYNVERPDIKGTHLPFFLIGAIIIGTILLLLLFKYKKTSLWKLWFFLSVWLTLSISFGAFINRSSSVQLTIVGIFAFLLALIKIFKPNYIVHNLTELFIYGGLAAIFVPIPGFNISSAIILLLLISAYDMYAVWKSKHMIKLAKFQVASNVFAGLFVPYEKIQKVPKGKQKNKKQKKIQNAILGGGDIAFPLLFAGVIMKNFGFLKALTIPLFTALALLILFFYSEKGKFYPAMPFLSAGCFVGYGVLLLLNML